MQLDDLAHSSGEWLRGSGPESDIVISSRIRLARNLADALHFIQQQRIKHQCEQILKGEKVSNFLNPRDLPKMAKEQLRDAFTIIDEAQTGVRHTYRAGL